MIDLKRENQQSLHLRPKSLSYFTFIKKYPHGTSLTQEKEGRIKYKSDIVGNYIVWSFFFQREKIVLIIYKRKEGILVGL